MKVQPLVCAVTLAISSMFLSQTYADAVHDIRSNDLKPNNKQHMVTRQVATKIDREHYLRTRLNSKNSPEVLKMYLDSLDSEHMIFLESDIKEFKKKYAKNLGVMLKRGNLTATFDVYKRYQQRIAEYYDFAEKFIKTDINLKTKETITIDREKAPYFTSKKEQENFWRKNLTLKLINITIAQMEEKAREKAFKEDPSLAKGQDLIRDDKRTPKEILKKRLNRKKGQLSRIKSDTVLEGILNAALGAYDPHSHYYAPVKATEVNLHSNLSLEGIGVSIRLDRKNPDYTRIEKIIDGGPASKTGKLRTGEFIIGVSKPSGEMVNIIGWSTREVVGMIRGKRDTKVTIRLQKPGASEASGRNVTIVRGVVEQEEQSVDNRTFEIDYKGSKKKIGVLDIPSFYYNYRAHSKGEDFRSVSVDTYRALQKLNSEKVDGLVVDLRNNPGGSLSEVVKMLDFFIKKGPLVQIKSSNGYVRVLKDRDGGEQVFSKPVVVLINLASASASEIFAAAIQDYNRGLIVGSTTTGKGSAQSQINRIRHGQMTLTQSKFYRVTGGSTQNKGVIPDIKYVNIYDEEFSERKSKHPLEYDTIDKKAFVKSAPSFTKILPKLDKKSQARRSANPQFIYLNTLKDLRDDEKEANKVIELHIDKRLADLHATEEKRLAAENLRRKKTGKKPYKNWDIYQAAIDAESEERSKMQRKERPKLPESEALVVEAANTLLDSLTLINDKSAHKK